MAGSLVDGYQRDKKALGFRSIDRAYIDPATPLTQGSYYVDGWKHKGDYSRVEFVVMVGEDREDVLKPKS